MISYITSIQIQSVSAKNTRFHWQIRVNRRRSVSSLQKTLAAPTTYLLVVPLTSSATSFRSMSGCISPVTVLLPTAHDENIRDAPNSQPCVHGQAKSPGEQNRVGYIILVFELYRAGIFPQPEHWVSYSRCRAQPQPEVMSTVCAMVPSMLSRLAIFRDVTLQYTGTDSRQTSSHPGQRPASLWFTIVGVFATESLTGSFE
nr:hypothetical protein CFP56_04285 [Quercus suber]